MNNGKDALTRLQDARNLNPAAARLAEDIARLGRKYGVFVDIDADDETLASYGGSAVLRASWMAGREDYTTVRPQ